MIIATAWPGLLLYLVLKIIKNAPKLIVMMMAKIHKMYQLDQSKSKSGSKITTTPTPAQLGWPATITMASRRLLYSIMHHRRL